MRTLLKYFAPLVLSATVAVPAMIGGCSARVQTGRAYDPYYHDYHAWDNNEVVYYNRWEADTHRQHRDFNKRNKNEQQQYFTWRHDQDKKDHGNQGHDHDNDRH